MISSKFWRVFQPPRLFQPPLLLGTKEYFHLLSCIFQKFLQYLFKAICLAEKCSILIIIKIWKKCVKRIYQSVVSLFLTLNKFCSVNTFIVDTEDGFTSWILSQWYYIGKYSLTIVTHLFPGSAKSKLAN